MKNLYICSALGLLLAFSSCQKLDQFPLDATIENNFWNTEDETLYAVTGLYNGWENGSQIFYMDCVSDNSRSDFPWENFQALGNGTATPTDAGNAKDRYTYEHIRRANWILENIGKAPIEESLRERLIGEVRTIRAYRFLDMAILFGDVPLITSTTTPEESFIDASKRSEVFKFVEDELRAAADLLPEAYGSADKGRMSKGAALGFLARAYAFQNKHEEVKKTTDEIIALGQYSLFNDYGELFEEANENNNEVIADIQYIAKSQGYTSLGIMLPVAQGGWSSIVPTQSLVDAYETIEGYTITEKDSKHNPAQPHHNRDPRLDATIVYPGALYAGAYFDSINENSKAHPQGSDNSSSTSYNYKKYIQDPKRYSDIWDVGTNIIVMRYAEVLLLNAEARIELNQIDNEVYKNLDLVRERVNMPKVDQARYSSQSKLRDLVRRELRVELAGEGRRHFDITRWGIAKDVMNGPVYGGLSKGSVDTKTGKVTYTSLTERFFIENRVFEEGKNELWPIPQAVIDNSKNTLQQNNGY